LAELIGWGTDENLLFSVLAHHGRPIDYDLTAAKSWEPVKTADFTYDPVSASTEIGGTLRRWFPEAFLHESGPLPSGELEPFITAVASRFASRLDNSSGSSGLPRER
jgi:hypothetical protein